MRSSSAVVLCLLLSGCFRVVVDSPAARTGQHGDGSGVSFLGLTTVTTDARECTYGIAKVETYMPFWGWLLALVTAGIVPGMTAQYHCAAPPSPTGGRASTALPTDARSELR